MKIPDKFIRPETVEKMLEKGKRYDNAFEDGVRFACKQLLEFGRETVEEKSCEGCKCEKGSSEEILKSCNYCVRGGSVFDRYESVGNEGCEHEWKDGEKGISICKRPRIVGEPPQPTKPALPEKFYPDYDIDPLSSAGKINKLIDVVAYLQSQMGKGGGEMNYSCQEEADFYDGHPEEEPPLEKELFDMVYQWGKVGVVVDFTAPAYQKLLNEITDIAGRDILRHGQT